MSIVVDNATKKFGDFVALDKVSIEVPDGSLTALLGPSGSGKSTLLRVIAGLEEPDSGSVLISGQDMTQVAVQDRHVGFCFQHYAAFKHMTVRDNVAFGLKIRKKGKEETEDTRARAPAAGAPRGLHRPLSVAAFRRPAPAHGASPGARGGAEGAAARRAVRRARREGARGAPRVAAPASRRGPRDDDLRHPRPGGGDGRRRADRGDERWPRRAGGRSARAVRASRDGVRDGLRRSGEPGRAGVHPPARPGDPTHSRPTARSRR